MGESAEVKIYKTHKLRVKIIECDIFGEVKLLWMEELKTDPFELRWNKDVSITAGGEWCYRATGLLINTGSNRSSRNFEIKIIYFSSSKCIVKSDVFSV